MPRRRRYLAAAGHFHNNLPGKEKTPQEPVMVHHNSDWIALDAIVSLQRTECLDGGGEHLYFEEGRRAILGVL